MNHRDYVKLRKGKNMTVGKFGDKVYACEIVTSAFDIPEYHQISKAEFDSFDTWKNEQISDSEKLSEISKRKVLCSGFLGCSEINPEDISEGL